MDPVTLTIPEPRRPPPRSLDDVRDPDGDPSYPVDALADAKSGLVLFAARWHGRQDAVHFADAGVRTDCVDTDRLRLHEMARVYPKSWRMIGDDVFAFAADAYGHVVWDVVSLDPFTQDFDRCAGMVDVWCGIATQAVILGAGGSTDVTPPRGWQIVDRRKRSNFYGGVYWVVMTP